MLVGIVVALPVTMPAEAQSYCPGGVVPRAVVISADGNVSMQRASGFLPVLDGQALCPGDLITTGDASGIDIRFDGKDSVINVLANSTIAIPEDESADIALSGGLMRFISSVRSVFRIRTPQSDAGIDGTEAMVAVAGTGHDTLVLVREGVVKVVDRRDPGLQLSLTAGEGGYSSSNTSLEQATPENVPADFRGYMLNPAGAADWAVYYPPVLLTAGLDDPALGKAAQLLDAGDPDAADALLAGYSGTERGAALALRAMVAVYRNRLADGLALSDQAVAASPGLGAAHVSRSYALQAAGALGDARSAAEAAVQAAPNDAYAWARLAELALTLGDSTAARGAADQSLTITDTSLARAVLGFAKLAEGDRTGAESSFAVAIALDSEAPLPRLGLGLAKISAGNLAAGRREIETAAALDPQRAQLRGWLGRAYLQEGLSEKAAAQFTLAKEQDPDDPSPWLFSALERFAANQPVTALDELQQADERADGRASVRGAEGLGEDQAVRDTAAGRIYDVLGFEVQAAQAGARAVASAPSNPGAHRFLADVYRARPGFEIAQSSELLTAQLLSKPSRSPVQPRLAEPDLALLNTTGTARVTFQEFAPLFDSDGMFGIASGGLGTEGRIEDELSLSIKEGNYSVAFGQFRTQTDGFRANDDIRHDVLVVEGKAAVTPWLTLTAEGRYRNTSEGDRFLRAFDQPTTITTQFDTEKLQFTLGGHAELSDSNDLLFFGAVQRSENTAESFFVDPFFGATRSIFDDNLGGYNIEVQDIQRMPWGTLLIGGSYANLNDNSLVDDLFADNIDTDQFTVYGYAFLEPVNWAELTLGLSYNHVEQSRQFDGFDDFFNFVRLNREQDFSQVNPKVGVKIEPVDGVVLRGAYARTFKNELIQDRTLEPTTIAGFNQFYDDIEQTDAQMFGVGADFRILDNVWIGAEGIYRELDVPGFDNDPVTFNPDVPIIFEGEERIARGYINATLDDNWAMSLGVDFIRSESGIRDRPDIVETLQIPLAIKYFHESGFFGSAEAIFFTQTSTGQVDAGIDGLLNIDTNEEGLVLNFAGGYRFPDGRGIASLEVNNVLDQSFALQNSLNNSARPGTRPLAEGVSVMGRVTVGF